MTDAKKSPLTESQLEERAEKAQAVIQRNTYWALGAGVLPLPLFDLAAITGVQLKMLRELSEVYDVAFNQGIVRKAVASLLVGMGVLGIGGVVGMSLFKFVPVVGASLGAVSVPVVSAMLTRAVGRTYVLHLESGGTLLDFDAKKMRKHFHDEYVRSREVVEGMKREPAAT
jgi:uncharacterized protein (DUF697 family)